MKARAVSVDFFKNETFEPRLVTAVNRALKRNLQQDGTYTLETQDDGDLIVTGELTEFLRNGVSYKPGDTLTAQDFNLQLKAKIKVTDRVTGKVVLDRGITAKSIVRVGNDLSASQRQAIPLIADQLARQATSLIVDRDFPKTPATTAPPCQ
jgi:ABC-type transport system substrate-binding protein